VERIKFQQRTVLCLSNADGLHDCQRPRNCARTGRVFWHCVQCTACARASRTHHWRELARVVCFVSFETDCN